MMTTSNEYNNAPAVPIQVNDAMAIAFHNALSDGPIDLDEMDDIKTGLNAALANVQAPAPAVPQTVYLVENRTCLLAYASREDADKAVASMPASVGGGFLVSPVQVFGAPAPAPAQEVATLSLSAEDVHAAFTKNFPKSRISQAWINFAADIAQAIAERAAKPAQEVPTDPNGWCEYVAGMVFCWLQMQKELPNEDQCVAAIAGIIERRLWAYTPAHPEPVTLTDEQKTWAVNKLMEQAQVFASAWSLVGGKFDFGNALDEAEQAKTELRSMVIAALCAKGGKL